jgi:hypothetical protein
MGAPPSNPADHAQDFAHRYAKELDRYYAIRMEELGIATEELGAADRDRNKPWRAFEPDERKGGTIAEGIVVDSGALNPDLLHGRKGASIWRKARLRDRIDAIIAHEYEENRHGTHAQAVKAAATTELPVTQGARRILRAMAR